MLPTIIKRVFLKYWPMSLIPATIWAGKGNFEGLEPNYALFFIQIFVSIFGIFFIFIPIEYFRAKKK